MKEKRPSSPRKEPTILEPVPDGLGSSTAERLAGLRGPEGGASSPGAPAPEAVEPVAEEPVPQPSFPGFTILERVGSGAFGTIFRAYDETLDREVAFKVLSAGSSLTGDARERFVREARALARVRHPNVLAVYAVLEHEGQIAIVTEFIEGETLEEIVEERGLLGAPEAAQIGVEISKALAAVHTAGIVHRDVKPANVLRERGGRFVLADFGLGVFLSKARTGAPDEPVAGTPLFMAPEQISGQPADPRTDLYSLGVLLYYLTTGAFPAEAENMQELFALIERGNLRPLRDLRPDLPDRFVRAVMKALATDPPDRFQSAGEMEAALVPTSSEAPARAAFGTPAAASAAGTGEAPRRRGIELVLGIGKWKLRLAVSVCALLLASGLLWIYLEGNREEGPLVATSVRLERGPSRPSALEELVPQEQLAGEDLGLDMAFSRKAESMAEAALVTEAPLGADGPKHRGQLEARTPAVSVTRSVEPPPTGEYAVAGLGEAALFDALGDQPRAAFGLVPALIRSGSSGDEPIRPGSRIASGEALHMVVTADRELSLYVVAEDARLHRHLLFPLAGSTLRNPLPPRTLNRLPGPLEDAGAGASPKAASWEIRAPAPRLGLLVVASVEPVRELEALAEASASSRPSAEAAELPYPRIEGDALRALLRRAGGLAQGDEEKVLAGKEGLSASLARLAGRGILSKEEAEARGVSVRAMAVEIAP